MQLEDWLDDLCVRFIINLPPEELESVERICFQVEEAQWFYEDFIRPLDPILPSLSLRAFSLRIFQHCPLFSQWSAQHHTTAFAEFLAYKSRVPVRGAIMLNEAMDEVVLVKGWKKGANWSFPRGKINKDENDLDCAVREVYEETGFDIQAAGLVKEEQEMKYIEVTMREQHMRLYVFRGVPKDTHFEPRTRKEISKIEWYKLTDLPTLRRNKQQDGTGDTLAMNANKFYMVAPFLNPLKKWIAQQRKKENRQSSMAPQLVTSLFPEGAITEEENEQPMITQMLDAAQFTTHGPSDLPELSVSQPHTASGDPSVHLKRLLNIEAGQVQRPLASAAQLLPKVDSNKSSALLALLRSGSTAELRASPNTPLQQLSFPPDISRSPHRDDPRSPFISSIGPPPSFQVSPDGSAMPQALHDRFRQFQDQGALETTQRTMSYPSVGEARSSSLSVHSPHAPPPSAPYRRTENLLSKDSRLADVQESVVPPASALPKLTTHTRSLLDVFKSGPANAGSIDEGSRITEHLPPNSPPLPYTEELLAHDQAGNPYPSQSNSVRTTRRPQRQKIPEPPQPSTVVHRAKSGPKTSLLDLFRQTPGNQAAISKPTSIPHSQTRPAELAAVSGTGRESLTPRGVEATRRQDHTPRSSQTKKRVNGTGREGETSATVNGPLNQPHFDSIARPPQHTSDALGRSPVPSHRTLFDPKQSTPVKILARPDENRHSPARSSPKASKASLAASSPKRISTVKELSKPFQPQILKRPQTAESQNNAEKVEPSLAANSPAKVLEAQAKTKLDPPDLRSLPAPIVSRKASDVNNHRQTLLSLFSRQGAESPSTSIGSQGPRNIVSPLTASQMFGSYDERSTPGNLPISTRSRVGSLASVADGSIRPTIEKRQTAAGDKAFLLGYLGRIASQESRESTAL